MLTSAPRPTEPPPFHVPDPYDRDEVADPQEFFRALRDEAAIVALEKYGVYSTGRYDETLHILNNWQDFSSAAGVGIQDVRKPGKFRLPVMLTEEDPPTHTQVRASLTKILSPKLIRSWRALLEREARALIDQVLDMKSIDGMTDLVEPYILNVFAQAVGLKLPRTEVLTISEMRLNQSGPGNQMYEQALARAEPYVNWFDDNVQRAAALPGSVSEQLYLAEDRGEIGPGVVENLTRTLIGGGVDSTMVGLAGCLYHLAADPDQMALATSDPGLMRTALDEGVRLETPFRVLYRTPNRDVSVSGFTLRKDRKIGLWLGAANRDPRKWDAPDKFDLKRNSAGVHVGFGASIHVCIGQMIARLEAECLLTEFAHRVKSVELDGTVKRRPMNTMCSFENIPLRVTPK